MRHHRLPNELYLDFDMPVVSQAKIEEGRKMNPKPINVGPFIIIRQIPISSRSDVHVRSIVCRKCPSMVGGTALREKHWTKYATNLSDALIKAGSHLTNCHSNGSSNEV